MRHETFLLAFLLGLGVFKVMELLKEAIPVIPPPAVKSALCLTMTLVAAAVLDPRPQFLLLGGAAAGIAHLLHNLDALLAVSADDKVRTILAGSVSRRERVPPLR